MCKRCVETKIELFDKCTIIWLFLKNLIFNFTKRYCIHSFHKLLLKLKSNFFLFFYCTKCKPVHTIVTNCWTLQFGGQLDMSTLSTSSKELNGLQVIVITHVYQV